MAVAQANKIDLGGYGVVVYPALPNDPPYENDPHSYVTKIFYRKKDYDDLRKKKKRLAKILGKNEGYQFLTYEREWLGRNLPPKVYQLLKEELNESNEANESKNRRDHRFYPIRMLHLGSTLQAIRASPQQTMNAQSCSAEHVLAAILHVCETVAALAAHHTAHGDIHAENLLIYLAPPFCDMTLIDYDLFETHEEVKSAYQEGRNYLYGPPEVYTLLTPSVQADPNLLRFYCARLYRNQWLHRRYPRLQDFQSAVEAAIQEHGDRPVSLHEMDSFPLSLLLLDILTTLYPSLLEHSHPMRALHDATDILEQGASLSSANRLGPDELVKQLRRILARLKGTGKNQENQTKKNQTRKNQENQTRENQTKKNQTKKNQENQTRKNQTKKNQENQTRKNQTKKNQENQTRKNCVISGGKRRQRKGTSKTTNISRRYRT